METLGAVLRLANIIFTPIRHCCSYHRHIDEHMKNLNGRWEDLNLQKSDIELRMRAQLHPGRTPKREVEDWIQRVVRMENEIEAIKRKAQEVKCFLRAHIGKRALKKKLEVDELHQRGGAFPDILVLDPPVSNGEEFPTKKLIGNSTTVRVKEKLLAYMLGNGVGKIGVCGMGGIGKSTIMEHINNDLLKDKKKFDSVVWVSVSNSFNVIQLQNDIAQKLNLDLSKLGDIRERAAKLKAEFEKRKRYALILDDLWEAFPLEDIGIPEPTSENGCKIVLTTRNLDVCRGMSCEVIKMELLSKEEAQELFVHKMGFDVFSTPRLKAYAEEVLQICAQLPLAIVAIAGSFKVLVHDYEWRDALERLRTSLKGFDNIEKQVHEVLKFSYERLKEKELKYCLLRCALCPEVFRINKKELIEHLIDERIIERMKSRQAEFDRGKSMLSKLENACLLEGVTDDRDFVKMHDLVRDMARQVASREYMVGHWGLEEFPNEGKWGEDLVKASLMYNNISRIPSNVSPMCPNLSTLLLQGNESLKNVPDSLFKHLHGLEVLDLSETGIESLPNSVFSLENLTALRLRECWNLEHVSSLAKLTKLRKLDLGGTGITEPPDGLEMLVNLTYLNLDCWDLKIMPLGILPKLSHLQYLRISCQVIVKGEELERLEKLENVWVHFDDLHEFYTFIRSIKKRQRAGYYIEVGRIDEEEDQNIPEEGKCVIIACNLGRGEERLVLPEDVQSLTIVECDHLTSLCDVLSLNHVGELKEICISSCKGIEHLFSYVTDSLQTLKKINIQTCLNIKKLLPPLLCLRNLEQIFVLGCNQLEEIIGEASDELEEEKIEEEGMETTKITLPNLRHLELRNLPELKTICRSSQVIVCDSLEVIVIWHCPKLKRLPLSLSRLHSNGQLSPPPSLKKIYISGVNEGWWESLEWDSPDTKKVLQPFVKFS